MGVELPLAFVKGGRENMAVWYACLDLEPQRKSMKPIAWITQAFGMDVTGLVHSLGYTNLQ
eukprot:5095054-Prorocentrum_lima.AAC.1